jgi:FdhD protein
MSRRKIIRLVDGRTQDCEDELVVEEPLEIRVRGRAISVTMRTPGSDEELALGFLLTEGVVRTIDDVLRVEPCGRNEFGNVVNVVLAPQVHVDFQRLTRHVFASSSCGMCGKASIDSLRGLFPAIETTPRAAANVLLDLPRKMRDAQQLFDRTGGLHAAALFDLDGNLIALREDVGRHNAADKVIGRAMIEKRLPLSSAILLVSGRMSFEIVQKALAARISVLAAVSAPSSLAVEFAEANRQVLVGFLRDGRMNVYTGGEHVEF